jgi:hypothetical protein
LKKTSEPNWTPIWTLENLCVNKVLCESINFPWINSNCTTGCVYLHKIVFETLITDTAQQKRT